jgi:hypothetical protein
VNVIGGHRVIEYDKPITLLRLKKPPQPSAAVSGKLEKKLLLMASMGNMPDVAVYVMSSCSSPSLPPFVAEAF